MEGNGNCSEIDWNRRIAPKIYLPPAACLQDNL